MEAPWISWLPAGPIDLDAGAEREVTLSVDWNQTPAGQSTRRVLVESNVANKSPYPDGVYYYGLLRNEIRIGSRMRICPESETPL